MPAVVAEGLVKRFGSTDALRGVDLDVERATVLGLLGPNGAGTTTTVRILTTLLVPDAGRAEIDGIDVVREPRRARARIGLTGQYAAVDERLTARENLEHVGRLYHLGNAEARRRGGALLERFDLTEADRLAPRIMVIDHGRVIAQGTPTELKQQTGGERIEVTLTDGADLAAGAGIGVHDVVVRSPTLDDVFLRLTGHEAEEEVAG